MVNLVDSNNAFSTAPKDAVGDQAPVSARARAGAFEGAALSQQRAFEAAYLPEFLQSGWILSLSANQILLGWGAWTEGDESLLSPSSPASSLKPSTAAVYAPDFYLQSAKPWRMTPCWDLIDFNRFANLVLASNSTNVNAVNLSPSSSSENQRFQWVEPEFSEFEAPWRVIQKGFEERGLKKAVPVVFSRAQGSVSSLKRLRILKSLVEQVAEWPQALHLYGFWGQGDGAQDAGMLGATPEILFSQTEDEALQTVALAGTRGKKAGENSAKEILSDPKERHEHELVIEDIREVLSKVGQVKVETTGTLELPSLFHLQTLISAKLSAKFTFSELVRMLHSTPALGVSPRSMGFSEMKLWDDGSKRKRYGAPFGVELITSEGQLIRRCVVAIRNIQWHDHEIRLGSGCGVVPESQLEREWRELQLKRESVKRILSV